MANNTQVADAVSDAKVAVANRIKRIAEGDEYVPPDEMRALADAFAALAGGNRSGAVYA